MFNFDEIINREDTRALKLEARENLFSNKDVIPLWVADMDFAVFSAVKEALLKRMNHPIYGYTIRPDAFFSSITGWLKRRFNWQVDKSWIEFSPGVVPNLGLAVQALTKPGEGIIIQPPVYPPFFGVVKDFDRNVVENPLVETDNGYIPDFEHFEEVCSKPENKLFIFCHPHNPVGRVWTVDELQKIGDICRKNNVIIISDEIHADLVLFGHKHHPIASISPEIADITVTCMAASKTFNLAGFSTSYMVVSNPGILKALRKQLQSLHLHMGNTFGALALEAAYNEGEKWLEELKIYIEGNYNLVANYIEKYLPEVKISKLQATYLLWMDFRAWGMNQNELKNFMSHKAAIGLNDGRTFGKEGTGFMRMNLASPRTVIEEAMNRIVTARKEME